MHADDDIDDDIGDDNDGVTTDDVMFVVIINSQYEQLPSLYVGGLTIFSVFRREHINFSNYISTRKISTAMLSFHNRIVGLDIFRPIFTNEFFANEFSACAFRGYAC